MFSRRLSPSSAFASDLRHTPTAGTRCFFSTSNRRPSSTARFRRVGTPSPGPRSDTHTFTPSRALHEEPFRTQSPMPFLCSSEFRPTLSRFYFVFLTLHIRHCIHSGHLHQARPFNLLFFLTIGPSEQRPT